MSSRNILLDYLCNKLDVHNEGQGAKKLICALQPKKLERKRKERKRKKRKTKEKQGKIKRNQRKPRRNQRQPRRGGGRQPREGRKRGEAALEGGESGGVATVHSHGPPPSPLSRFSNGKLPI